MNNQMHHLSLSWLALPALLAFAVIGVLASPHDDQGHPLLLLPDVKAVEDYRRAMASSTTEFQLLDGEIAALLAGQNADLFSQSQQAQTIFEHALRISQDIDRQPAPPALDGLRAASSQAASAYVEASRLALVWVSLPAESNHTAAVDGLTKARQDLETLETSKWLAKTLP